MENKKRKLDWKNEEDNLIEHINKDDKNETDGILLNIIKKNEEVNRKEAITRNGNQKKRWNVTDRPDFIELANKYPSFRPQ